MLPWEGARLEMATSIGDVRARSAQQVSPGAVLVPRMPSTVESADSEGEASATQDPENDAGPLSRKVYSKGSTKN